MLPSERDKDAQEVNAALAAHDLAGAERAATDYQRRPGYDPATLARWSKEIWTLADAQVFADSAAKKRSLGGAISEARKNHPNVAKWAKARVQSVDRRDFDGFRNRAGVEGRGE